MNKESIEIEIKRQLGLSISDLPTGTAPLDTSQSPEKGKQSRSDGGKKKNSKTKHSNIRVETTSCQVMRPGEREALNRVKDEAVLELEYEKKARKEGIQKDFQVSEHARKFLEGKYIYLLEERSAKFPRAKWFCRLCEYHCDNLNKCLEHIYEQRHQRLTRQKELDTTLNNLPRPSRHHLESLNRLLAEIERDYGLSSEDMKARQELADSVHSLLEPQLPGCSVKLYGSSLTGFGLKTANVNLDLQITDQHKPHIALVKALEILKLSSEFHSVTDDFTSKIPTIRFSTHSNLHCELGLNNFHASQTSSLLRDYNTMDERVRTLGVAFRYWASLVNLDRQSEGTLPPHSFAILLVYFLQQQSKPVLPCIHSYLDTSTEETVYTTPVEHIKNWRTQNQMTPAELWIDLFVFFSMSFSSSENVVSIKKSGLLTNEEKNWKSKKLAIEDPFSSKRSLCRSIQSLSVYDYITNCLKTGYLYFGTIQTSLGPVIERIIVEEGEQEQDEVSKVITLESWLEKKGTVLTKADAERGCGLVPRNMIQFKFDGPILTNHTVLEAQCVACGSEGHLASSCPEEILPQLSPLRPLPRPYQNLLTDICHRVVMDWQPQRPELKDRQRIMTDLTQHIRRFWPTAELSLFGSSNNGFAFKNSDLDISLTFAKIPDSSGLDSAQLIEELGERLKRLNGVKNVLAITSAKVPIVKMYHLHARIEADISLYNILAQENTRMLSLYADLDSRCHILGYMAKLFAKICDIGDASRGSLSSYAYILMMIFFLQKVEPPVLPVLQELYEGERPQNMVDGWDAWFCEEMSVYKKWPGWGKNKATVGQLWVDFLDFFARKWDDKKLVVSIRQSQDLSKFEKMWISPCIAIEDPFELSHNLGAGISRKMNLYIKKAFIKARDVFGNSFNMHQRSGGFVNIQAFFFDKNKLTDGAPPNDRGCRACGKIGHLVADCPKKRAVDTRKREQRETRERLKSERSETGSDRPEGPPGGGRVRTRSELSEHSGRNGSDSDTQRRNISDSPHHQPPPPFARPPPRLGVGVELPPGIRQMAGPAIQLPRGGEILRPPAEAGIDLAVLAALAGNSPADRRPMPDLRGGAITAEDLEASFLTDPDSGLSAGESEPDGRPRLPPGFGAPSRVPPQVPPQVGLPPHPLLQQQLLQRHFLEQNNLRQRQLSGDILGIQGLANLGLGETPLTGQGGPPPPPPLAPGPFGPMILPYRLPPHLPLPGGVEAPRQPGPVWPSLGPLIPPFGPRDSVAGFPSSVLFPGDLRHPFIQPGPLDHLLQAGQGAPPSTTTTNPLPIPTGQPVTPEPGMVAEGSPMTPPSINFDFED